MEQKTQTKICCPHTWLLHGKGCPSRWRFPRSLLTASKPGRRSITAAKRKEEEKKERPKTIPKIEKPKAMLVARKPSYRDASAVLTRLKLIWPRSSLKNTKMSKKRLFRKKLRESMGQVICVFSPFKFSLDSTRAETYKPT